MMVNPAVPERANEDWERLPDGRWRMRRPRDCLVRVAGSFSPHDPRLTLDADGWELVYEGEVWYPGDGDHALDPAAMSENDYVRVERPKDMDERTWSLNEGVFRELALGDARDSLAIPRAERGAGPSPKLAMGSGVTAENPKTRLCDRCFSSSVEVVTEEGSKRLRCKACGRSRPLQTEQAHFRFRPNPAETAPLVDPNACPRCGHDKFIGLEEDTYLAYILVDSDGEFEESISSDIVDSTPVHGPYRCQKCEAEYTKLAPPVASNPAKTVPLMGIYTVYGYYPDNQQISIDYVEADGHAEALRMFEGSGETTRHGIVALPGEISPELNEEYVGGREYVGVDRNPAKTGALIDELSCQKCGGVEFEGHQVQHHSVLVDKHGAWVEDIECYEADRPFGPFYCRKCGAVYPELPLSNPRRLTYPNRPRPKIDREYADFLWGLGKRISGGFGFWKSYELERHRNPILMVQAWLDALADAGFSTEDAVLYGDWPDGRHMADRIERDTPYHEFYMTVREGRRDLFEVRKENESYKGNRSPEALARDIKAFLEERAARAATAARPALQTSQGLVVENPGAA